MLSVGSACCLAYRRPTLDDLDLSSLPLPAPGCASCAARDTEIAELRAQVEQIAELHVLTVLRSLMTGNPWRPPALAASPP